MKHFEITYAAESFDEIIQLGIEYFQAPDLKTMEQNALKLLINYLEEDIDDSPNCFKFLKIKSIKEI